MTEEAPGARPTEPPPDADPGPDPSIDEEKWPLGFMLTIGLAGLYLAWRLIQGIVLFVEWIF